MRWIGVLSHDKCCDIDEIAGLARWRRILGAGVSDALTDDAVRPGAESHGAKTTDCVSAAIARGDRPVRASRRLIGGDGP